MEIEGDDEWKDDDENEDERVVESLLQTGKPMSKPGVFGAEVTNNPIKRPAPGGDHHDADEDTEDIATPPKKQRRSARNKLAMIEVISDGEWIPPAVAKRGKRTAAT